MNKSIWEKAKPHVFAIAIFIAVSCIYCLPALKGLVVNQHDMVGAKGMAQQSVEFREKHGHFPLWTNSMFGGMPAYQIYIEDRNPVSLNYLAYAFNFLPQPANFFFIACVCFYLLCCTLNFKFWIRVFGALAYAFSSYNVILIQVGHITKFAAMGYAPAVIAGVILIIQKRYWLGLAVSVIFWTLFIGQNHIQIVYYFLLLLLCLGVAYFIKTFKTKEFRHLFLCAALILVSGVLGFLANAVITFTTYEYAKETMRGGRSELTTTANDQNKTKGGLDKDYAFLWSYGVGETMTFMLPAYNGGGSGPTELGENSKAVEAMQNASLPNEAVNYFYPYLSSYWGNQPSTSGPVYLGAIVCLLFIAGLVFVRNWHVGWIIAASIIGILMAWGNNFSSLNYFLFDHLPMYNKFRAPSMAMIIPQFTFCLLAAMALQEIFYGKLMKEDLQKKLRLTGMISTAVIVVLVISYLTLDFTGAKDKQVNEAIAGSLTQFFSQGKAPSPQVSQQASQVAKSISNGLVEDRKGLFGKDLLRLIILSALFGGILWLALKKRIKTEYALIAIAALSFIDQITVDTRYLNTESFVSNDDFLGSFNVTRADTQIKQDTGYFRVFDQTAGSPFEDSRASYYFNSIGGYHPAKLALYQDLIEHQLSKGNMRVYNMLNTKYFITPNPADRQPIAQQNPGALGPCWFVKGIQYVNNANEEMKALDSLNTADSAVIDKRERGKLAASQPQFDSSASIRLISNLNDEITYSSKSSANQFAVFSEIYYPLGWHAYIDGKEVPIVKADYALRGLFVPAGDHKIEFMFKPKSYSLASTLSLLVSLISFIIIGVCIWLESKRRKNTA